MHRIGILQGRLSPMIDGVIQAFPTATWETEFAHAQACGFELLEWDLDLVDAPHNPLLNDAGAARIAALSEAHGIAVPGVCGDFFMRKPLHADAIEDRCTGLGMLVELIRIAPRRGLQYIELPLLGGGTVESPAQIKAVVTALRHITPLLAANDVDLLLEVGLPPPAVRELLDQLASERIRINYDCGNSAYYGFDMAEEFKAYGDDIGNVHIKDCTPADYSVPLGEGDVDFPQMFRLLADRGYAGDFILQTARGDDDLAIARAFGDFTRRHVEEYLR
jgi:hexulose-6-phosphate isomerase